MKGHGWALLAAAGIASLTLYLGAVFLLDEELLGVGFGRVSVVVLALAAGLLAWLVLRKLLAARRLKSQTVAVLAVNSALGFIIIIVVDLAFTVYVRAGTNDGFPQNKIDSRYTIAEYYPNLYYPTERNFRLHKPGINVAATSFGNFYDPSMLQSPTLRSAVLEPRRTEIEINDLGFRERDDVESARIFALGDSLTFGWQVNVGEGWVDQLEALIGEPIYNLGIHDSSPRQELFLLEDLLRRYDGRMRIEHLLWLIYEGNDLEDSYETDRPDVAASAPLRAFHDTLIQPISQIPRALKSQSFITRLRTGQASLRGQVRQKHDSIDGVSLAHPVYFSGALGPRLFYRPYIERAGQPESYVRDHPNLPALERTLSEIATLSRTHRFRVSVILAPSAARLHGPYYDDFPPLSERPHFLDLVGELASDEGFQVINLYALLAASADQELLYFHDDDHWNLLGNQRAARLIAEEVFGAKGDR